MKIIHCADIHLGSRLVSKFPKDISDERRSALRTTLRKMVDFAKSNDVKVIILSGDVFDSDKPAVTDKKYFYSIIKNNPDIDFLYLNGNHDKEGSYSVCGYNNLKMFSKDDFTSYTYGNVVISGIETDENNCESFYSKLELDKSKLNIVMLHGYVSNSRGKDLVKISDLRDKGIDYLALGHIHSHKDGRIDDRGVWAFPGCLEPRGFDECGEKGFILIDASSEIGYEFIPFSQRTIHEINVDVTDAADLYEIEQMASDKTADISREDIIRLVLTGELSVDIELNNNDIENALAQFYYVNVKNKTTAKIDIDTYKKENSIISEFIAGVESDPEYDDALKNDIITAGVRLLLGKEVD